MKIIVFVKQIRHTYARTGMDPSTHFLRPHDAICRVNPYDEAAMELACRAKESAGTGEIVIVTLGALTAKEELERCMAMGADDLVHIPMTEPTDSWSKSLVLAWAAKELEADLILCGRESLDRRNGQVGAFVAHHLGVPFVGGITGISLFKDSSGAQVKTNAGRGVRQAMECPLPSVFSADMGVGTMRIPSLKDKKRAKSFSIRTLAYSGNTPAAKTASVRTFSPRPRPKPVPAPESALPSHARIERLLTGSRVEKKAKVLTAPPEELAEAMVSFLEQHGFIATGDDKGKDPKEPEKT